MATVVDEVISAGWVVPVETDAVLSDHSVVVCLATSPKVPALLLLVVVVVELCAFSIIFQELLQSLGFGFYYRKC
eukprot:3064964-Amphidinium_carterae.1